MSGEFSDDAAQDTGGDFSSSPSSYGPSEPTYREPPQSWQRDVAERHWHALPDDLRSYVSEREKGAAAKITQQGQRLAELEGMSKRFAELEGAATRYQPIDSIFERYRPHIPEGLEPAQAIEALLNVQQLISTPETREQAFAQLVQSCGVDPMALLPPQMRQQFETAQRELQSTKQAEVQRTLDEFTKGKDYYPEIREDVIKEIVEIRKGAPGLDNATVLRLAHDRVVDRTGIKSRLEMEAKAREAEETQKAAAERAKVERAEMSKRITAAKRAAGINLKSTPVRPAPRSMDDELREIARRAYGT